MLLSLLLLGTDALICIDCYLSTRKNSTEDVREEDVLQLYLIALEKPNTEEYRQTYYEHETAAEVQRLQPETDTFTGAEAEAETQQLPPETEPEVNSTAVPPEPALTLPKYVKKTKPAKLPEPDRILKNTRKVGQRTGSQTNPDIPIGKRDTAQQYGERFSKMPRGGPKNDTRCAAMLGTFLKIRWSAFIPARAQLGDANPEVTVFLSISGDGRLIESRIERPSGNAAMDSAVQRLLESLKTQQLPRSPDGQPWSNRVIFDTNG